MTETVNKKTLMSDNSSYQIHAFMRNQLHLKGNELLVYAVIYSFTTKGDCDYFYGTRKFLSDYTGAESKAIGRALKCLVEKGLIVKGSFTNQMGKFTTFRANLEAIRTERKSISTLSEITDTICEMPKIPNCTMGETPIGNERNACDQQAKRPDAISVLGSSFIINKKENNKDIKKEIERGLRPENSSATNQVGLMPDTKNTPTTKSSKETKKKGFQPPTLQEVREYWWQKGLKGNPDEFFYNYDSIDWNKGNNKIANWKSAAFLWSLKEIKYEVARSKKEEDGIESYEDEIQIGDIVF